MPENAQFTNVPSDVIRLDAGDIHLTYPLDTNSIDLIKNSLNYLKTKLLKESKIQKKEDENK